jgi:hypothetical protein
MQFMYNVKLGDKSKIGILDPDTCQSGKPHYQLEEGIRYVYGHDNEAVQ